VGATWVQNSQNLTANILPTLDSRRNVSMQEKVSCIAEDFLIDKSLKEKCVNAEVKLMIGNIGPP
jgi:hypothetical protein